MLHFCEENIWSLSSLQNSSILAIANYYHCVAHYIFGIIYLLMQICTIFPVLFFCATFLSPATYCSSICHYVFFLTKVVHRNSISWNLSSLFQQFQFAQYPLFSRKASLIKLLLALLKDNTTYTWAYTLYFLYPFTNLWAPRQFLLLE